MPHRVAYGGFQVKIPPNLWILDTMPESGLIPSVNDDFALACVFPG